MSNLKQMMFCIFFSIICFSFIFPVNMAADTTEQESLQIIESLDEQIPELMKAALIPGLQIALIRDGSVIWENGYGVVNAETGIPVTKDTVFEAASLTKPFFAFLAMKLVEGGKIGLDMPLVTYVPRKLIEERMGHSMNEKGFRKDWLDIITPRMVLSHSSGLPHGEGGKVFPILFKPGSKWKYSATGYGFLQMGVEVILKEKLGSLMKKRYLDPLGMKNSSMVWKDEYEKSMASGHNYFGKAQAFRKRARATAAASLYTTAGDYAKFVCAVMAGKDLKKETLKTMLTPQIRMEDGEGLGWGLGFGTQNDKEKGTGIWQWGDYGIFRNYILAFPEKGTGVVFLTNSAFGLSIADEITRTAVNAAAGGALALEYDRYNSPFMKFSRKVLFGKTADVGTLYLNMKKEYGDLLPDKRVAALAGLLGGSGMGKEAIEIFQLLLPGDPDPPEMRLRLAEACLGAGDLEKSETEYKESLKQLKEDDKRRAKVAWYMEFIQALRSPFKADPALLKKLAGEYGPRHVVFKEGKLYYRREGTDVKDMREMIPMGVDTFVIRKIPYFRLKFDLDSAGNPVKVIGLYDEGRVDSNLRTKKK